MLRRATAFLFVMALLVGPALAQQQVTIDQLNTIPDARLNELVQNGPNLTEDDIADLIENEFTGVETQIVAVVMTDPLSSGLSSFDADRGGPNRIHVFVRDTTAASQGPAGMGMQLVDANYETTGLLNVVVGDVVRVTGELSYFGTGAQFIPQTVEVLGSFQDFGFDDSILDPVTIDGTDVLNINVAEQTNHVNWQNYSSLINQYIRIEGATLLRRTIADAGRPNWNFTSDGGETFSQNDDLSLRYRNDRIGEYADTWNVRSPDNPFVPPAPGSIVDVQGYVLFRGAFEAFDFVGQPSGAFLQVSPFTDEDLQVVSAPTITRVDIAGPDFVPGAEPVPVVVEVEASQDGVVADAVVNYTTSAGDEGSVTLADQGDGTYTGEIPAFADGAFVTYQAVITDTNSATFESDEVSYRILVDGIDSIEDVQLPADPEGEDTSTPFVDLTTTMAVEGVVQTVDVLGTGAVTIQDDAELGPWTGLVVELPEGTSAAPGDVINVTEATIIEDFDVTTLIDATVEVVSTGGAPYEHKTVTTDVLQNSAIAEAHEGMLLRFDGVTITDVNADGPDDPGPNDNYFGEWQFSSDGTEDNEVRADDQSPALEEDFSISTFENGDVVDFIQGIWWFSFGNYKIVPTSPEDIGGVNVSVEDDVMPGAFALDQNYPNPFNPETSIRYEVGSASPVTLTVYDVLGREVATLVNRQQPAGTYTVTFDAQRLPSGLYLYRLEAGGQTFTRTMMLLK